MPSLSHFPATEGETLPAAALVLCLSMDRPTYSMIRANARTVVRRNGITARILGEARVAWFTRLARQPELRTCIDHVRQDTMFIDVGAMLGDFSLASCHHLGRTGIALALEPNPVAYQELVAATTGARVSALNLAASDHSDWATLEVPLDLRGRPNRALGSLELRTGYNSLTKHRVRTVSLDDIVNAIMPVSVIKIDVEGHELAVMRGAADIIRRDRPVLVVEIEARHLHDHGMAEVIDWVRQRGYDAYAIGPEELIPWRDFDIYNHQTRWLIVDNGATLVPYKAPYINNFLFLPEELTE